MEDVLVPIVVIPTIFLGLPWLIMHYVTRWKTAATLTNDDERMLSDMHELARRLEDRLETVERLVAVDNPDWQPRYIEREPEAVSLATVRKLERKA
jgi:phage shock protein B